MQNIYLIGFMGSGKSTLGKKLAAKLGLALIDTDSLIEEREGKSVSAIFKDSGEEHFRTLEHTLLLELKEKADTVVATGGGTPCFFNNMELMNQYGVSIYISMTPAGLYQRLEKGRATRPLLTALSDEELLQHISDRLQQRESYYKQAKYTIKGESATPQAVIDLLQLR